MIKSNIHARPKTAGAGTKGNENPAR